MVGGDVDPMMGPAHPGRPPRRAWHSATFLDRFAITTWAVAPDRLTAILPDGFEPERFEVDEREVALVSSVSFVDRDYRFRFAPFVKMACGQINHRCYVRRHGEPGVWFVGTSLDHPLVGVAQVLWSMPWHREPIETSASVTAGVVTDLRVRVIGDWGDTAVDAVDGGAGFAAPPALRSPLVTDPLVGWYPRRDGRLGRYTVWHPPLGPELVALRPVEAWSAPFERLGLTERDQPPLGVTALPSCAFDVHTPPRRLR